jgi:hypothetical protein
MITVQKIDTQSKTQVRRFVDIPFRLYAGHPQWVPPLLIDVRTMLNRQKHPFYEHSAADFFVAVRDGRDVGRVAALENTRFNATHGTRQAQFYLFECEDDPDAAAALFDRVFEWARGRVGAGSTTWSAPRDLACSMATACWWRGTNTGR